jgi:hypothetical protein
MSGCRCCILIECHSGDIGLCEMGTAKEVGTALVKM